MAVNDHYEIDINIPEKIEVSPPPQMGPSQFPTAIDQLKTIEYSSVPSGGQLEKDLHRYHTLMASISSNTASEQDYVSLKEIMLRVRNYVLTEDDFNLMADAVRNTQYYLREALDNSHSNFYAISSLVADFQASLNDWSKWLAEEVNQVTSKSDIGGKVFISDIAPPKSAFGYIWVDTSLPDDYIAPALGTDRSGI